MSTIDLAVLFGTLLFITIYGVWKSRGSKDIESYLLGNKSMPWWTIGLSIMATQASAITFLSTPGQAYKDGMGFIQFYFGLPIAMVILSITVIPIFYRLKVYTAYEYLETRFDLKTRSLGAFLFLIQRGLAAGITIYAPSIILSTILGWKLMYTNLIIGILVIIYTVSGGTKAVSQTQKQQMAVMMGGMIIAGIMIIYLLPEPVGFKEAYKLAGDMGKLNIIDLTVDFNERYNLWSGLIGGLFVAMAYFGTDQSQVQRYLGGKSIAESRLGLLFNGLLKIPMQFIILYIGAMVFVFYQFNQAPVFFNEAARQQVLSSAEADNFRAVEQEYTQLFAQKKMHAERLLESYHTNDTESRQQWKKQIQQDIETENALRAKAKVIVASADSKLETTDTDYVFITFVTNYLPKGLIGLLLAVIFSAAMSSTSSELNALASTTTVDIYKRSINTSGSDAHYLGASRWFTLLWGLIAIGFATFASLLDNLIQAVNILGSIFYGTILGIFLVAFYMKYIKGNAVFIAALISQAIVLILFKFTPLAYLWYNVVGCVLVIVIGFVVQFLYNR
jgi:solute:Na+ symporter, SSS family